MLPGTKVDTLSHMSHPALLAISLAKWRSCHTRVNGIETINKKKAQEILKLGITSVFVLLNHPRDEITIILMRLYFYGIIIFFVSRKKTARREGDGKKWFFCTKADHFYAITRRHQKAQEKSLEVSFIVHSSKSLGSPLSPLGGDNQPQKILFMVNYIRKKLAFGVRANIDDLQLPLWRSSLHSNESLEGLISRWSPVHQSQTWLNIFWS